MLPSNTSLPNSLSSSQAVPWNSASPTVSPHLPSLSFRSLILSRAKPKQGVWFKTYRHQLVISFFEFQFNCAVLLKQHDIGSKVYNEDIFAKFHCPQLISDVPIKADGPLHIRLHSNNEDWTFFQEFDKPSFQGYSVVFDNVRL